VARELTKEEALALVEKGEAGYYALTVRHPVPHSTQIVLRTQDRYFLMNTEELSMKPVPGEQLGMRKDGPIFFNTHLINLKLPDDSEIVKMVQQDLKQLGRKLDESLGSAQRPEHNLPG
jgi:hypothetical protein